MTIKGFAGLQSTRGVRVGGEAGDGEQAIRLARQLRPDIVLVDLRIPRLASPGATRLIKADRPKTKVMILMDHREDAFRQAAGKLGPDAFLAKRALVALLLSGKSSKECLS